MIFKARMYTTVTMTQLLRGESRHAPARAGVHYVFFLNCDVNIKIIYEFTSLPENYCTFLHRNSFANRFEANATALPTACAIIDSDTNFGRATIAWLRVLVITYIHTYTHIRTLTLHSVSSLAQLAHHTNTPIPFWFLRS